MENNVYIKIHEITKKYYTHNVSSIKKIFNILFSKKNNYETKSITALNNITLQIKEGEQVGIIGFNGSGKTTLLNIITNNSSPTEGSIDINGNINAIMDIGVSIKEELTGVENIYLSGELHGKTKSEIGFLLKEIIDFIDIGDYINKPMKIYSSGVKARLSFATISFIEPEILIIDEVLGAGDNSFISKSQKKIDELCSKGKILLIVSHSMKTIRRMTKRCIWLDNGKLKLDGNTSHVTQAYLENVRKIEEKNIIKKFYNKIALNKSSNGVNIKKIFLISKNNKEKILFQINEEASIQLHIESFINMKNWDIELYLYKVDGTLLSINYASQDGLSLPVITKGKIIKIQINVGKLKYAEGIYEFLVKVVKNKIILATNTVVIKIENSSKITISMPEYYCDFKIESKQI